MSAHMDGSERRTRRVKIGILEVQGAFLEHKVMLQNAAKQLGGDLDLDISSVRYASDVTPDMAGMILPGGESTTMSLFLNRQQMMEPLKKWILDPGHVTWGTCAGMILLSKQMENQKQGGQASLGILDTDVSRNYFGRQVNSFEAELELTDPALMTSEGLEKDYFHGVFIRAPAAVQVTDPAVTVLATLRKEKESEEVVVALREGDVLATAFHPELTEDCRWHKYFLQMVLERSRG